MSLNTSIVKLTAAVDSMKEDSRQLRKDMADLEGSNRTSHQRMHERLDGHENRLTILEVK